MQMIVDIDEAALRLATEALGTTSTVATVNAALRRIAEQRASRLLLEDCLQLDLDLDEATLRRAWRG